MFHKGDIFCCASFASVVYIYSEPVALKVHPNLK